MSIEIVDLPINSMVIFQFVMFLYQRVDLEYSIVDLPISYVP